MVKEFENKGYWALVLGGSSGLGLASAKKLAKHGMNIIMIYRCPRTEAPFLEPHFEEIKNNGVQLHAFNADALNTEIQAEIILDIKNKINTGKLRCLVHSIAKGSLKPMAGENALQDTDLNITMTAMAFSLYSWVKALHNENLFANDARVISFTSEGSSKAWPYYGAVSAAKAALEAISRSIALEFASFGIKSNCIQAGVTDTQSFRMIPGNEELALHSVTRNPYKRLTTPEDVANVVYLLCKDEAAWINGAVIPVNGGEHLQ